MSRHKGNHLLSAEFFVIILCSFVLNNPFYKFIYVIDIKNEDPYLSKSMKIWLSKSQ